jgi:hypothetical protein
MVEHVLHPAPHHRQLLAGIGHRGPAVPGWIAEPKMITGP